MKSYKLSLLLGAGAALLPQAALAQSAEIFGDFRGRYESVEQTGKLEAESLTLRSRVGVRFKPADTRFSFLAEIENNITLAGDEDRNTSLDPLPQYATINDPDFTELNRAQLGFKPNEDWSFTVGRQYLGFDGNRIIGSPGHRQDKNSHDAAMATFGRGAFEASYVYHWQLNRGPGDDVNWETDAHLFHASYDVNDALKLSGFVYLIDIPEPGRENLSNTTYGARLTGSTTLGEVGVSYDLLVAAQNDSGSATADFDNTLIDSGVAFSRNGARLALGYDVVSGDGTYAFANPFAANHGTAGWADVFHGGGRAAPANGLEDFHVEVSYGASVEASAIESWRAGLIWHEFEAENTSDDLGQELDLFVSFSFANDVSLSFEMADYDGPDAAYAPADRTKYWVTLGYKF
ncbi:MAG: hypothetical protein CMH91_12080 [Oceanicaulis sp.]|uniref:hypothetical protein n=1 Tax=unclassified Oceanicaulis TaxID=2632123 RepID=UPI000C57BA7E|nr:MULTISPECIES: hypothetical protein [unclassified Oceanicaulis]MAB68515.1 hypothetical protein [Oceanicaulis sp.]MAB70058.1 hypothetical protein [Oceanicaulis sp.]MBC39781.1 hypothetical protein [Oceanicaulis sp.]MBG36090.1 hypothetical protein [Oceanicaulis sp.]HBU63576.1 hypothetical protein [Oceanicaulis sp.]|tara:strand:- start:5648 stop:6862 length:1215 start_codon:yes stop_codon:yes gene_type:complete